MDNPNLVFSLMLLIAGTIITLGSPIKDDGKVRVEFTDGRLFLSKQPDFKNLFFLEIPFAMAVSFTVHTCTISQLGSPYHLGTKECLFFLQFLISKTRYIVSR